MNPSIYPSIRPSIHSTDKPTGGRKRPARPSGFDDADKARTDRMARPDPRPPSRFNSVIIVTDPVPGDFFRSGIVALGATHYIQ